MAQRAGQSVNADTHERPTAEAMVTPNCVKNEPDVPGMNATGINTAIKLFWLGVGTDDFLYGNAKSFMDNLDEHGIKNVKVFTNDKHGHTWMNARYFLDQSFRLLFQDKPYDIAKANPTPKVEAPAPRQDQQFTPGVMARMFPKPIVSPEYNQDGSVTFRYKSDNASQVELECQMFSGHIDHRIFLRKITK